MSTNFIINPYSISFESIRNDLMQYVSSKPDEAAWKDFFASGAGQTIIELIAALGAMYSYQFILGRREAYLSVAQNYSSILGVANNAGYCASRGQNARIRLTIVPNVSMTLPKWSVMGTCLDYDLVLLEDVVLNTDQVTTIDCIIGNFLQETITVQTDRLSQFKFTNSNTTDDIRLILNTIEVPLSTVIKEALNDKYVGTTNVYGSLDIFYLQEGEYKYKTGDSLILQFIERNTVDPNTLRITDYAVNYASKINTVETLQNYIDKESADSIKIKAPIYRETAGAIRARHDYSKFILTQYPILKSANDHDIYPGLIEIAAVKKDGTFLTDSEKDEMLDAIESARPSGVAKAIISNPQEINKTLNIEITKLSDEYVSLTISDYIDAILETYEDTLGISLDLHLLEHEIDKVSGVKISRVTFDQTEWEPETYYELYHTVVSPTDTDVKNSYSAKMFIYKSGSLEPSWPTIIGDTVVDNQLVWQLVNEDVVSLGLKEWSANNQYFVNDYVRKIDDPNNLYKCIGYINLSGLVEPDWKQDINDNQIVFDEQIVWKKVTEANGEVHTWQKSHNYNIGDFIAPTTAELANDIYICIGFRAKSGSEEPEWTHAVGTFTQDGRIQWVTNDAVASKLDLAWNEYLNITKELKIV